MFNEQKERIRYDWSKYVFRNTINKNMLTLITIEGKQNTARLRIMQSNYFEQFVF